MASRTKILVISDEIAMLNFAERNFDEKHYEVVCTQNTEDELRTTIAEVLPDLILLDIMMPTLDGIEVCLRIRQWSEAPIMMLSTWGAGGNKIRSLDLNSDSYLDEPFDADELMARIGESFHRNLAAISG